MAKAVKLLTN